MINCLGCFAAHFDIPSKELASLEAKPWATTTHELNADENLVSEMRLPEDEDVFSSSPSLNDKLTQLIEQKSMSTSNFLYLTCTRHLSEPITKHNASDYAEISRLSIHCSTSGQLPTT